MQRPTSMQQRAGTTLPQRSPRHALGDRCEQGEHRPVGLGALLQVGLQLPQLGAEDAGELCPRQQAPRLGGQQVALEGAVQVVEHHLPRVHARLAAQGR